ncbi:MAG: hypothetical protein R3E02_10145 [Blastomonas sp.]
MNVMESRASDAEILFLIGQAIDQLTVDGYELLDAGTGRKVPGEHHIPASQRTIAIDLQRIDSQLGPKGATMLFPMGTAIIRAVMALEAAQTRLEARS